MNPIKIEIKIMVIKIREDMVQTIGLKPEDLGMLTNQIEDISFQLMLEDRISQWGSIEILVQLNLQELDLKLCLCKEDSSQFQLSLLKINHLELFKRVLIFPSKDKLARLQLQEENPPESIIISNLLWKIKGQQELVDNIYFIDLLRFIF